jgi:hypothetical protein
VIIVMLGLSVLAGIGLYGLTRGRAWWIQIAILLCASVAVPLDLWGRLAGRTNTLSVPGIYTSLASQPKGLVAEYPLTPVGHNNYGDLFFQNVYEKPMINGYLEGTAEERRALSLANISDPATGPGLAALGVRYVLLDAAPPGYDLPSPGKPGRDFRLLFSEPYGSLYLVTARPSRPALPAPGESFGADEVTPAGNFSWLEQPRGTIEIAGGCVQCRGVLTMTLTSFARPRTVVISSADGRLLASRVVAGPTRLAVPLEFAGHTSVHLAATPGPQSIIKTTGSPDPRSVSVSVGNLDFAWPAGPRS